MEINSKRAKTIDAYIESHPDAEISKWPIEIAGEKKILPFYKFPIKGLLFYNKHNGRLTMEVMEWEAKNGRELDKYDDSAILCDMLLELDKEKTKNLEDDLLKKGQMEPGVITHDGFVINGNRRMAILEKRLHPKEPTGKWEFLEAIRLPAGISEKDLWKIEAGLQLTKDKVAEYHPVNELLKIKQGIDSGLEPKEIAAAIYGWTVDEINDALYRLKLIDNFLDFCGQTVNYGFIKKFGLHEYFIDMQKMVVTFEKQGVPKRESIENAGYTFALLRANVLENKKSPKKSNTITHLDFRKLRDIFLDNGAKSAFIENMQKAKKIQDVASDIVIEDFKNASDFISMKEQRNQPVKLIEKAINALESIDQESKHFCKEHVESAFGKLLEIVSNMEKKLNNK